MVCVVLELNGGQPENGLEGVLPKRIFCFQAAYGFVKRCFRRGFCLCVLGGALVKQAA